LADSTASNSKFTTLLIAGGISLVVGVGSGFLVNWLSEKRLLLTYDITAIQAFPGQQERIGIVAVRVANGGQKELESIDGTILFTDAVVKEVSLQGLTPNAATQQKRADGVDFRVPFLNAGEQFSVQVLVTPKQQDLQSPSVSLRAKGTVGRAEAKGESKHGKSIRDELFQLIAAIGAALVAGALTVVLRLKGRVSPLDMMIGFGPSDDQRDVFAYVLGLDGFLEEAQLVRHWPRDWSYWSISDFLTERWLSNAGDKERLTKGRTVFEHLLQYAQFAKSSSRILHLNSARLAMALGDTEAARIHVQAATTTKDIVISKRLLLDQSLSNLAEKSET